MKLIAGIVAKFINEKIEFKGLAKKQRVNVYFQNQIISNYKVDKRKKNIQQTYQISSRKRSSI